MKTARLLALLAAAATAASLLPRDAAAVPVFARKYGFNCTMCHSAYPRLNDFGARFRAGGYRLPGLGNAEKTVLETPPPVALRTSAGYVYDVLQHSQPPDADGKRSTVELAGLDLLSGGLLGPRVGFFLVYVPGIPASRGVAEQEAALEMASVVFSGLAGDQLTVRAGRFEPAYAAFSVKRHLSLSGYEVYGYSFPGGPTFSDTQTGLELRGSGFWPVRILGGVVEGSATNRAEDPPQDAYLRLEGVVGPGEGQTAGQRLGLTGYLGRARPDVLVAATTDRTATFARLGADASLNGAGLNLAAQVLWGQDDGPLWGRDDRTDWWGGFAELSGSLAPGTVGFARFDYLKEPDFLDRSITRFTAGGRFYFEDAVALHLEYSHRMTAVENVQDDPAEDFIAVRLDLAI